MRFSYRSAEIIAGIWLAAGVLAGPGQGQPLQPIEEDELAPVVVSIPDSVLGERLQTIFESIDAFSQVEVRVTEGVVRLGGAVDQPENRRKAEEIASRLQGVVYVVNDIETATDVETRVDPAVTKIREYWDNFVSQLPVIGVAVLVLLLFSLAGLFISRWRAPPKWSGINQLVWSFINRLIRGILVVVGLILAFDVLGITSLMGAVLGTAGIVGLALGFAFQDIVENYLAGMLLSLRRPFLVNDLIRIGEFEGKVIRLTSRELVLLTLEGNHVRLPNAHVFKNPLVNFTANPKRLLSADFGISVKEDVRTAMDVGTRTLQVIPGILKDPPPFARVSEIDASGVNLRYHGWVDQREVDYLKVRSEMVRLLKEALDESGIEMPEPTYRVLTAPLAMRETPPKKDPQPEEIDIRPDGVLDRQVREDLATSDDENLLE